MIMSWFYCSVAFAYNEYLINLRDGLGSAISCGFKRGVFTFSIIWGLFEKIINFNEIVSACCGFKVI